jgi:hypothetical protein
MTELTPYELERERRIAVNRQRMLALGLRRDDVRMHDASRARASGKDSKAAATARAVKSPTKSRRARDASERDDVRRSSRRRKIAPERFASTSDDARERDGGEGSRRGDDETTAETRALHERAAEEYAARNAGKQERAAIVGTTSYNHTLMRVKTMDERGLERRMHAIRNARGKHCVTKMRLFARVLFLEGYEDLAGTCVEALEELVAELGDPDEEDMKAAAVDIAREERDGANFRCDAATDLSDPSVYADVVRIEAKAVSATAVDEKPTSAALAGIPNANRWQVAAAALVGADGALKPSGNVVSFDKNGAYHVARVTPEMRKKMKR